MELSISASLLRSDVSETVKTVVEFTKNHGFDDLKLAFLQFIIHRLNSDFIISPEHLENWDRIEVLRRLLIEIHDSDNFDGFADIEDSTVHGFFEEFFAESFAHDLLSSDVISSTILFLNSAVHNPVTANNDIFKVKAIMLASFIVSPMAILLKGIRRAVGIELHVPEDLDATLVQAIDSLLSLVALGFIYKNVCQQQAKEFISNFENNLGIVVEVESHLKSYKQLLMQENSSLHSMALKSLQKLCGNEAIREQLLDFLFEVNEEETTFMKIFEELMNRKVLKTEPTSLLTEICKIRGDRELLSDEQRLKLYLNVFSGNKKLVEETEKLMEAFGEDIWTGTVRAYGSCYSENFDLKKFVDLIGIERDLEPLKNLMFVERTSQAAARIFVEFLKHSKTQRDIFLQTIDKDLFKCLLDDKTFGQILEFLHNTSVEELSVYFTANHTHLIEVFACVSMGFESFNEPLTLFSIVSVMDKLQKFSPEFFIVKLREIFEKHLTKVLDLVREDNDGPEMTLALTYPLRKLSVISENDAWNIIDEERMKEIFSMSLQLTANPADPLFTQAARFFMNFLKHLKVRVTQGLSLPFDAKDFGEMAKGIKEFAGNLFKVADDYMILSTLLELLLTFQPANQDKHPLLQAAKIEVDRRQVLTLTELSRKFINEKQVTSEKDHRQMVMQTYLKFYRGYEKLPTRTSCEKVIRHYHLRHEFKDFLETLMTFLLNSGIFLPVIAFSVLNLANNFKENEFRNFLQGIDDFLTRHYNDDQVRTLSTLATIASRVLMKLPDHLQLLRNSGQGDRLKVLDCVLIIAESLDRPLRREIHDYIPPHLHESLIEGEVERMETFKAELLR